MEWAFDSLNQSVPTENSFMWTCPNCKEQVEDGFDSCWKCAAKSEPSQPVKTKKPFEQYETLCLVIAFLPGVIFFARGHSQNSEQATFRIAAIIICFIAGFGSFSAIKMNQRAKSRLRK